MGLVRSFSEEALGRDSLGTKEPLACASRARGGKVARIREGTPCLHGGCTGGYSGHIPGLCHLFVQLRWDGGLVGGHRRSRGKVGKMKFLDLNTKSMKVQGGIIVGNIHEVPSMCQALL